MLNDVVGLVFCGEGSTELGREASGEDGFLHIIVNRALADRFGEAPSFRTILRRQWKDVRIHRGGRRPGQERRACVVGAKLEMVAADAIRRNADGVVFIVDDPRAKCSGDLEKDVESLRRMFGGLAIAAGTAVRMIEVALLADKNAVARAFEGLRFSRTKSPEDVADPKSLCERDFCTFQHRCEGKDIKSVTWAEARRRIFEHLSLDVLTRRCPKGIGRFIASLDAVVDLFGNTSA